MKTNKKKRFKIIIYELATILKKTFNIYFRKHKLTIILIKKYKESDVKLKKTTKGIT